MAEGNANPVVFFDIALAGTYQPNLETAIHLPLGHYL